MRKSRASRRPIEGLPEAYRLPVILCCVEGRTQEEAAGQLGWTMGSLQARLERGRGRLHRRLRRRGLALPSALGALELSRGVAAAQPSALASKTVEAAILFAARSLPATAGISAPTLALAEGALKSIAVAKMKIGAVLLMVAGVAVAGVGAVAYQVRGARQPEVKQEGNQGPVRNEEQAEPQQETQQVRTDRYGDPLPDGAVARLGTVRFRRAWQTTVYSHDGKTLTGTDAQGDLFLCDAATGKELRRSTLRPPGVCVVAVSADGKRIATETGDNTIQIWDAASAKELRRFGGESARDTAFAFSRDGSLVAAGGPDKVIRLWDTAAGQVIQKLSGHKDRIELLVFSPDSNCLASTDANGITLWQIATGKEIGNVPTSPGLNSLLWLPDRNNVISGGNDGNLRLWETPSGKSLGLLGKEHKQGDRKGISHGCYLACTPDGKTLISALDGEKHINVWEVQTGRLIRQLAGYSEDARQLTVSPDGKTVAAGCGDCTVYLWDLVTGQLREPVAAPRGRCEVACFSANGKLLATGGENGNIHLWDTTRWIELRRLIKKEPFALGFAGRCRLTFAADGKLIAPGWGISQGICEVWHLWDVNTGNTIRDFSFRDTARRGYNVHLLSDGKLLAVDGVVLDSATMKERYPIAHGNHIGPTPDGKYLLVGNPLDGIAISELNTGKLVRKLPRVDTDQQMFSSQLSSDCKKMITGSMTGTVHLWDLETGKELRRFKGPNSPIEFVALSPDGKMAASVSNNWPSKPTDFVVFLWEVATGKERRRFPGHRFFVSSLTFSPDGKWLVSTSHDTTALVWDTTGQTALGPVPPPPLPRDQMDTLWTDLGDDDAGKAYRVLGTLIGSPVQAPAFLNERLRPAPTRDAPELRRLLADLDSERFAVRQRAEQALAKLGVRAEGALREVLAANPTLEVRNRVERLLQLLPGQVSDPERLREMRAVEVLEHIGTPDARQVLNSVSKGAAHAQLTQEAKASLERLVKRPRSQP